MNNLTNESLKIDSNYSTVDEIDFISITSNFISDILMSVLILIFTFPILIIASILIKIDSKGPILYSQLRLGRNNKEYKIYKLRTMYIDSEINGAQWAEKNDKRITRVGNFLRKTRIDEIPQLLNVLKREMSLVGPRPERAIFVKEFAKIDQNYLNRTVVRPGLTGWSQVNGGYEISPFEKLSGDLHYIKNQSVRMDLIIIFRTVKIVITGDGARWQKLKITI